MIFYERPSLTLHQGHVLDVLREMPSESVHMVVTSPPYWGLRNYGIEPQIWPAYMDGGKAAECEHEWGEVIVAKRGGGGERDYGSYDGAVGRGPAVKLPSSAFCRHCLAWRGSLGLEPTPEMFVGHIVEIFREVRRVLRKDGTCWVNMGDGYASGKGKCYNPRGGPKSYIQEKERYPLDRGNKSTLEASGLKPKDLIGMPWRVAFALQADGWWLRSDIVWSKANPMPESVTDRPTKAHEYIFLLTKSGRYFYDAEAVKEACNGNAHPRGDGVNPKAKAPAGWDTSVGDGGHGSFHKDGRRAPKVKQNESWSAATAGLVASRNLRSVWEMATESFSGAHFATFPSEVPRRCIKAGTSERGVCPQCGAPWKRVVEKKGLTAHDGETECQYEKGTTANRLALLRQAARERGEEYHNDVRTLGFRAACGCGAPSQPATVLDPFGGSGTVGIVANELGRRAVLIELNPEYAAMARERLRQEVLL